MRSNACKARKNSSSSVWLATLALTKYLRIVYNDSLVIRQGTIASYLTVLRILVVVNDVFG